MENLQALTNEQKRETNGCEKRRNVRAVLVGGTKQDNYNYDKISYYYYYY